jgi:integrase
MKIWQKPFTVDELRSILGAADAEWQSLIKFGLYTGQRLADLAALRWTQIDLERDEIRLATRKTAKSCLFRLRRPYTNTWKRSLIRMTHERPFIRERSSSYESKTDESSRSRISLLKSWSRRAYGKREITRVGESDATVNAKEWTSVFTRFDIPRSACSKTRGSPTR